MVPLGIHRHTDAGLLTLLVEDGHHALQVLHAGQWRTIEPSPNAFIVNTGDMLQVLSNVLKQLGLDQRRGPLIRLPPADFLMLNAFNSWMRSRSEEVTGNSQG